MCRTDNSFEKINTLLSSETKKVVSFFCENRLQHNLENFSIISTDHIFLLVVQSTNHVQIKFRQVHIIVNIAFRR